MPNGRLTPALERAVSIPLATWLLVAAGLVALQALALFAMGQPLICECGTVTLWHGVVSSPENSQQLSDWYTWSHVIHGFGFYLLLWLLAPQAPVGLRFVAAIALEAGWEIFENTPMIIDRYRQGALAQGYVGDSIVNSVSDTLAMAVGFLMARRLPAWSVLALVVGLELFALVMIRDNLTLNIVQLVAPNEALSRWQMGE